MTLPVTAEDRSRFLEEYVNARFNFSAAARAIGRHPTTMYDWLDRDEGFANAFHSLKRVSGDAAYAEAFRRAVDGVEKPVFGSLGPQMGSGIVGHVREYSDSLLALVLKTLKPEFQDRQHHEVHNAAPVDDMAIAQRVASILAIAEARKARGEVVDAEFTEVKALPPADGSDLA